MNQEQIKSYREQLLFLYQTALSVQMVDIPKLLQDIERAETLGPFLDPTLWRNKSHAMAEDKELLEAVLPFWRMGEKLLARLPAKTDA